MSRFLIVACACIYIASCPAAGSDFKIRGIKGLWWEGIDKYNQALPWLAEHNLNFLMLCYTSFPASGSAWRSDYTPEEKQQIRGLAARAKKLHVNICLAFNPGVFSNALLTYSSELDYQTALDKVKSVHELGVNWFALCLDDINREMQPADKAKYGTLQAAQVYFVNRLYHDMKTLRPLPKLIFCPSIYVTDDAQNHLDYIQTIGRDIDRDVMMFWTGPQGCSTSITAADARKFGAWIRRKPFVWDNYPVNDMFGWRPLVSPLRNRSADLADAVAGYIANPMRQWNVSKIPLSTTAAYLTDPQGYDPDKAMESTIESFPANQQRAVRLLVELYGSKFWGDPGFPDPVGPQSGEEARRLLPKYRVLRNELSSSPGLAGVWEDCRNHIEADIAFLERASMKRPRTPTRADGYDFGGGAASIVGSQFFGRIVNLVYASSTGKNEMHVEFQFENVPQAGAKLRIVARDDDAPEKCSIRIAMNGHTVFEGQTSFGDAAFEEKTFDLPASNLKKGANVLSITNLEPKGPLGMPPWFMVAEAEIVPR